MADITLQFHALPEELLPLFRAFVEAEQWHSSAIVMQPFAARSLSVEDLAEAFADPRVWRVLATFAPPDLAATTMNNFLDRNPDALQLELGRKTATGLQESWLTGRTDNPERLAAFKRMRRKVEKMTRTGVTAVNPDTNASAPAKTRRFSEGAKALEQQGVPMYPIAGKSRYKFAD